MGKYEQDGLVVDDSAFNLLSKYPPHMVPRASEPDMEVSLKLPYDLLRDLEKAKDEFSRYQLGRHSDEPVESGGDGSVCDAHFLIPTRGKQNTPARIQFWQEELAANAGQWVEIIVEPQRYSFAADRVPAPRSALPAAAACATVAQQQSRVQRVGTKLLLRSIKPLAGPV